MTLSAFSTRELFPDAAYVFETYLLKFPLSDLIGAAFVISGVFIKVLSFFFPHEPKEQVIIDAIKKDNIFLIIFTDPHRMSFRITAHAFFYFLYDT